MTATQSCGWTAPGRTPHTDQLFTDEDAWRVYLDGYERGCASGYALGYRAACEDVFLGAREFAYVNKPDTGVTFSRQEQRRREYRRRWAVETLGEPQRPEAPR